jgi:hypothetical protein
MSIGFRESIERLFIPELGDGTHCRHSRGWLRGFVVGRRNNHPRSVRVTASLRVRKRDLPAQPIFMNGVIIDPAVWPALVKGSIIVRVARHTGCTGLPDRLN